MLFFELLDEPEVRMKQWFVYLYFARNDFAILLDYDDDMTTRNLILNAAANVIFKRQKGVWALY
jgi:hypothetical protein